MKELDDLFRRILLFIGDLNRMEIRLDHLSKYAKMLDVETEDLPESEKTIERLKQEANVLHDKVNGKLDGE